MDSTELNKILAAFLTAGIAFGICGLVGGALIRSSHPQRPAFVITDALPEGAVAAAKAVPIAALLADADPQHGRVDAARQCGACHSFNKGGATLVGPNLYGVIDAAIGQGGGYDFSQALQARHGRWSFEAMNDWLRDPKAFAPGTRMAFAGIARDKQRADLIGYLRTLSDSPLALPAVPKVP